MENTLKLTSYSLAAQQPPNQSSVERARKQSNDTKVTHIKAISIPEPSSKHTEHRPPIQQVKITRDEFIQQIKPFKTSKHEFFKQLLQVFDNDPTPSSLYLGDNQIGAEGAQAIAQALQNNTTLRELDLRGNQIRTAGAQALANALEHNKTLSTLDLAHNQIGAEGAQAIATALKKNTTLKYLDLGVNQIGAEGAQELATALQNNSSLSTLGINYNQIGDEGAQALAHALHTNSSLSKLDLKDKRIGDKLHQLIKGMIDRNIKTKKLISNAFADGREKEQAESARRNAQRDAESNKDREELEDILSGLYEVF